MKIRSLYVVFIMGLFSFLMACGEGAKGQQKAKKADAMETYRAQEHRFEIKGYQLFVTMERRVLLDNLENL